MARLILLAPFIFNPLFQGRLLLAAGLTQFLLETKRKMICQSQLYVYILILYLRFSGASKRLKYAVSEVANAVGARSKAGFWTRLGRQSRLLRGNKHGTA